MVFSSIVFLCIFLPFYLVLYFITPQKFKNITILVGSILFYSWGAPKFIFVILGTTFLDFHLVKWMDKTSNEFQRKVMLSISVCVNIGLLFYFKYSNFFIENFNLILGSIGIHQIKWTSLILPIGISFYTFETITYVMDVYRRVHKPLKNFWNYQTYIILFPKLIAGPIIRYHELADQITDRSKNETVDNRLIGFYRFCIGLAKKVIIANYLGHQADIIFNMNYAQIDSVTAWIGILAYTFQIYFDFSGYSDMAIGIGRMMGFVFPENFNNPYISQSITEFWRRWHITLGKWMRNYLYIPLGGNRVNSKFRLYFNLWFVFLASGLWHGASWSFIIWGAYHGIFLVLERAFLLKIYTRIGKFFSTIITFLIVVIGWVFFRVEILGNAYKYLKKMFEFSNYHTYQFSIETGFYFIIAIIFAFFCYSEKGKIMQDKIFFNLYSSKKHIAISALSILLLFISISYISASGFNPFIYFRF